MHLVHIAQFTVKLVINIYAPSNTVKPSIKHHPQKMQGDTETPTIETLTDLPHFKIKWTETNKGTEELNNINKVSIIEIYQTMKLY